MSNRHPPEEIVPALTHHNREARRYAAMMLGVREDDQLVPFLADLLQSGSVPARRAAAHALGTPTGPVLAQGRAVWSTPTIDRLAVESLTAALEDLDVLVRVNSAQGLGELTRFANGPARHRDEPTLDLLRSDAVALPLIHALQDPVAVVRTQAATSLSALAVPAVLPALIPLLHDLDREVRIAAAIAAGKLGAPQSLPVLLEILRDGPREARRQAAVSLRFLGDAAAVPALMDVLADPSRSVREEAAVALGHLGDPRAVPALMNALTDANIMAEERKSLREDLVTALGRLGDCQAVPALTRELDDYDKNVRCAAISALAQLGGPRAEDALISIVRQNMYDHRGDSDVRQAIWELESMGSVRAMPVLRLVIEEGHEQWTPLVAHALRQLGDTITAADMVEWLNSPDSDDRLRAVLALPELAGQDALPPLLDALVDPQSKVRAEATRQLGRLGDRSVIPFLTDALEDEDEEVRRAVRASLDLLAGNPGHVLLPRGQEP